MYGGMPERTNGAVLKTAVSIIGTEGSNPSPTAFKHRISKKTGLAGFLISKFQIPRPTLSTSKLARGRADSNYPLATTIPKTSLAPADFKMRAHSCIVEPVV